MSRIFKMASLAVFCRFPAKSHSLAPAFVRFAGYWNKDWKPGPYPKTQKEREAAANKYGLRVEDYEPYADDGDGYGDYPKLPLVSEEARDQYEDYDMPSSKRNFGEPLNVDFDMVGEERMNYNYKPMVPYWMQFSILFGIVGIAFYSQFAYADRPFFLPVMPKSYPYKYENGQIIKETHYTFETAD